MIALIAALLLQDRIDANRVSVANAFEQAFKAQGLPARLGEKRVDIRGWVVEDKDMRAFATRYAPANGAVLVASATGTLWVLAGGTDGDDAVPVAFFGEREGVLLVAGAARKGSNTGAEALHSAAAGHENRGSRIQIGDNLVIRVAVGSPPRDVPTPDGKGDAPPAQRERLAIRGVETLARDLDDLAAAWPDADRDRRRELAVKLADAHRPPAGVLACITKGASFLVLLGADGSDAHPDGTGVQVSGRTEATVVLVPGRARGAGKPGLARGADAFIVEQK
jgi:hypothetical protein